MPYIYLHAAGVDSYREIGFLDISDNRPGGGWYKSEKIIGSDVFFEVRTVSYVVHVSDTSYSDRLKGAFRLFGKPYFKRWDIDVDFDDDTVLVVELDVYAGKVSGCRYDWGEASQSFLETVKTKPVIRYPYRV